MKGTRVNSPLVSVLMPCYNAETFLAEALNSIVNQSYRNLEILCIDDGSSDNTAVLLNEFAEKDPRIVVVRNETNLKLIATLNKGIHLSNGKYIARMDADDVAFENRIETLVHFLETNPEIDLVCPATVEIDEKGKLLKKSVLRNFSPVGTLFASFLFVPIGHPEILCRTLLLKHNLFSTEPSALHTEDYELWSRLIRKGHHLVNLDIELQYYRINSQSVSRKYEAIQDTHFAENVQFHIAECLDKKLSIEVVRVICNRLTDNTSLNDLKIGLREIGKLKKEVVQKENVNDANILEELDVIYKTHYLDVCYQAFKNPDKKVKLYSLRKFVSKAHFFFNKAVFLYWKNKIKRN